MGSVAPSLAVVRRTLLVTLAVCETLLVLGSGELLPLCIVLLTDTGSSMATVDNLAVSEFFRFYQCLW